MRVRFQNGCLSLLVGLAQSTWATEGLSASVARLFAIRSTDGGRFKNCTATLLKIDGRCHLLTAAHCLSSSADLELALANSPTTRNEFFSSGSPNVEDIRSINISVAKSDPVKDLADLNLPNELQPACEKLRDIPADKDDGMNRVISYRARGYAGGKAIERFTSDLAWDKGYSPSYHRDIVLGPSAFAREINDLYVTPGMSGGLVDTNWEEAAGIISQLVMFQMRTYVIPMPRIREWLKETVPASAPTLAANSFRNEALAAFHLTPRNDRDYGGGNSHGDGDDSWIKRLQDLRLKDPSPLAAFREPDEGVPNPLNANERILAFGPEQVDGSDDFYLKALDNKMAQGKNVVTRPEKGDLDPKIRSQLLKRLDGYYSSLNSHLSGDDMVSVGRNIFFRDPESPEGWKWTVKGRPLVAIDLDAKKGALKIEISSHPITEEFIPVQVPAETFEFKIQPDSENKTIELISPGVTMRCENRHFLKLICIAPQVEFSISMLRTADHQAGFRFARTIVFQGKEVVDYIFGRLGAVKDPKKWRE